MYLLAVWKKMLTSSVGANYWGTQQNSWVPRSSLWWDENGRFSVRNFFWMPASIPMNFNFVQRLLPQRWCLWTQMNSKKWRHPKKMARWKARRIPITENNFFKNHLYYSFQNCAISIPSENPGSHLSFSILLVPLVGVVIALKGPRKISLSTQKI